jgi:hypothetical protein
MFLTLLNPALTILNWIVLLKGKFEKTLLKAVNIHHKRAILCGKNIFKIGNRRKLQRLLWPAHALRSDYKTLF